MRGRNRAWAPTYRRCFRPSGKATTRGVIADSDSSPGITLGYARPFAQASVYYTRKDGRDFCQYSNSGDVTLASLGFFGLRVSCWIVIANKDAIFAIFSAIFVWISSFTGAFFFCRLNF